MKFKIRTPSLKKRISARTSLKRHVRHSLGLKAPRGAGWITDPKRALRNRVYNRTTVSVDELLKPGKVNIPPEAIVHPQLQRQKPSRAKIISSILMVTLMMFLCACSMLYIIDSPPTWLIATVAILTPIAIISYLLFGLK